MEFDLARLQYV